MKNQALVDALAKNLPEDASEAQVNQIFASELFKFLGFELNEQVPSFPTGSGTDAVDYAIRHSTENNIFSQTKTNPDILVELKARNVNLAPDSTQYKKTVVQIKRYLLAEKCKTVKWGIITNANHIQLFRKHGKVIHPATVCLEINPENIIKIAKSIKEKIDKPQKALTVAVYNMKGGVGKTTTTVNTAATLSLLNKKVLIVDFDPDQRDLTNSLAIKPSQPSFNQCLVNESINVRDVIYPYKIKSKGLRKEFGFDVIPIALNEPLEFWVEHKLRQEIDVTKLSEILEPLKNNYDYILIDSSPNWRIFSQSAIYAADVVLMPAKHNNLFSLENAAVAIKKYIPEVQREREDRGPLILPIFFNGEKATEAQMKVAKSYINQLIKEAKKDPNNKFDLLPYFYPRYTAANKNIKIFELPYYAAIANSAFSNIPAVYKDKIVREYYKNLVKEYFLL
ncbi:AAA family ATPase [Okeania sp. SIO2B3]|uniref:AAA family ATPase n=1 Tax=Okeania sp. SIO2B3 TaxID=2607784 RepID=UPI0013C27C07|nr:AAA family ATPase [Okeania sp. SIO2B3]NET45070.1 AAA family ATPase [Okeania sp. SIO2B3]